jgi:hypothetical protein
MAVGEVGVGTVEGEVADERFPAVVEQPSGLASALAGAEVEGGEAEVSELDRLPGRNDPVREGGARRPLVAEDRAPLGALGVVVITDLTIDVGESDDRHLLARQELGDGVVVVGMRMRDEHAEQRLVQRLETGSKGAPLGEQERGVDRRDPLRPLDEVGVDKEPGLAGAVGVDGRRHGPPSEQCGADGQA